MPNPTPTGPTCGRGVAGDFCARPPGHDGDCNPTVRLGVAPAHDLADARADHARMTDTAAGLSAALTRATRERDAARAHRDRLAETLREMLDAITDRGTPGVRSVWLTLATVDRWRAVLADGSPDPMHIGWYGAAASLEAEATTRREIAGELNRLAASERLGVAWLERHDLLRHLATPPAVLRAVAADVTADKLHGRRERWDPSVPPGGWVCAEPDPDRPDGICGMPVEDTPCTVHHPAPDQPRP